MSVEIVGNKNVIERTGPFCIIWFREFSYGMPTYHEYKIELIPKDMAVMTHINHGYYGHVDCNEYPNLKNKKDNYKYSFVLDNKRSFNTKDFLKQLFEIGIQDLKNHEGPEDKSLFGMSWELNIKFTDGPMFKARIYMDEFDKFKMLKYLIGSYDPEYCPRPKINN